MLMISWYMSHRYVGGLMETRQVLLLLYIYRRKLTHIVFEKPIKLSSAVIELFSIWTSRHKRWMTIYYIWRSYQSIDWPWGLYSLSLKSRPPSPTPHPHPPPQPPTPTPMSFHEVSKLQSKVLYYGCVIALNFDRRLGNTAAEACVKFQRDTIMLTPNLMAWRLRDIPQKASYFCLVSIAPGWDWQGKSHSTNDTQAFNDTCHPAHNALYW